MDACAPSGIVTIAVRKESESESERGAVRLPGCARLGNQRGCDQSPGRSFRLECRNEEGHGTLRWTVYGSQRRHSGIC